MREAARPGHARTGRALHIARAYHGAIILPAGRTDRRPSMVISVPAMVRPYGTGLELRLSMCKLD